MPSPTRRPASARAHTLAVPQIATIKTATHRAIAAAGAGYRSQPACNHALANSPAVNVRSLAIVSPEKPTLQRSSMNEVDASRRAHSSGIAVARTPAIAAAVSATTTIASSAWRRDRLTSHIDKATAALARTGKPTRLTRPPANAAAITAAAVTSPAPVKSRAVRYHARLPKALTTASGLAAVEVSRN